MIEISKLQNNDIGRNVIYHREFCKREFGKLSSWNDKYIFVRFKGPNGEACEPEDVSFEFDSVPVVQSATQSSSETKKILSDLTKEDWQKYAGKVLALDPRTEEILDFADTEQELEARNNFEFVEFFHVPQKGSLTVDSITYAHSVAKALNDGLGKFSSCRYIAVKLETGDPVDGDDSYVVLESRLSESFGKSFQSEITIVGPHKE